MFNTFDGKSINVEQLRTPAKWLDKKSSTFKGLGVGFCLVIMFLHVVPLSPAAGEMYV